MWKTGRGHKQASCRTLTAKLAQNQVGLPPPPALGKEERRAGGVWAGLERTGRLSGQRGAHPRSVGGGVNRDEARRAAAATQTLDQHLHLQDWGPTKLPPTYAKMHVYGRSLWPGLRQPEGRRRERRQHGRVPVQAPGPGGGGECDTAGRSRGVR